MTSFFHRLGGSAVLAAAATGMIACGSSSDPAPPAATGGPYAVGGTVSGLPSGGELTLLNNGGDALTIAQSGSFAFATDVASGAAYAVTIGTQPTNGLCSVTARTATGLVASSDIASVEVTCVPTFAVGGTVSGLASGGNLTLGASDAGNATVNANGSFTLPTRLQGGDAYAVAVTTQPTGQTCSVTNGSGSVAAAAVTNVAVNCSYNTQWAYVLNHGSDTISTLGIDALTSAITPRTPNLAAQDGPQAIATNGLGTLAAVANNFAKTLSVYQINGVTGELTALAAPVPTANLHPRSVAITGSLVFVVVTDFVDDHRLLTYRLDTSAPSVTLTDTRILPVGNGYSTAVDVNGQGTMVAATVGGRSTLSVFAVDHANARLIEAPSSPTIVLVNPAAVRFNPSGTLLLAASSASNDVSVYGVAPNGALTEKAGSPFATGGTGSSALAIDALGSNVYVANTASNNVSAFSLDQTTGVLTAAAGSPFATGAGPASVSVDRSTLLVFVSNRADGTVSAFRSSASAALTAVSGSPFTVGSEPAEIAFGPP